MNEEVIAGYFPSSEGMPKGKTFRPSTALRNKYWFTAISMAVVFWLAIILGFYGISFLISLDESWSHAALMNQWLGFVNFWTFIGNMIWLIPTLIGISVYIDSIEYSVISESGEASPEIYVKKGIINVTKKHVPFRTITNLSSRAGVLDRLFGIGNVEIQTAGNSINSMGQSGPEERLEGIRAFEELTRFILGELRKFRNPYTTATEIAFPHEDLVPRTSDSLDNEMLITLREIRDVLERIDRKMDKEEK